MLHLREIAAAFLLVSSAALATVDVNPIPLGRDTMANSVPVTMATDQPPTILAGVVFDFGSSAAAVRVAAQLGDGAGNKVTSQVSGGQRPLDTAIIVAGIVVDPRARTWVLAQGTDATTSYQGGVWTAGRTWTLALGTDSVTVYQGTNPWVTSRTWNLSASDVPLVSQGTAAVLAARWPVIVTDGTNTMPTMDTVARAGLQKLTDGTTVVDVKPGNTAAVAADKSLVVALSPVSSIGTGTNIIGGVNQGNANDAAHAWTTKLTAGSDIVAVKPASSGAIASDPSLVVTVSPNAGLPAGNARLGAIQIRDGTDSPINKGQAIMSGSLPVVIASDQTGLNTFLDKAGSGTITGNNGAVTVTTNGCSNITFNYSGTWNATTVIEATTGDGIWFIVAGIVQPAGVLTEGLTGGLNLPVTVPCGSLAQVRIRANAYTSGTINIGWDYGAGTNAVQVFNLTASSLNAKAQLQDNNGAAVTLGQAQAATSLPVVTQADTSPATQNITAQDTATTTTFVSNFQAFMTGTPTAGSVASFALSSFEGVEVQVTGTWTGTLQSEISLDGGTTWLTRGVKQAGVVNISSSFTSNFAGGLNFAGMTNYRVRSTTAMTGTATVKVVATIHEGSVTVTNPVSESGRGVLSTFTRDYSTGNLTTGAFVTVISSTGSIINEEDIFDTSGLDYYLAYAATCGALSNASNAVIVSPSGGIKDFQIPIGQCVGIEAKTSTISAGTVNMTFYK